MERDTRDSVRTGVALVAPLTVMPITIENITNNNIEKPV